MSKKVYINIKRILDILLSISVIVILSPIFILIGIFIKLDSKGPLFFTQERIGLDSQPFTIYKFRTMYITAPSNVPTSDMKDSKVHVTRMGRFLRKSSLDELPQIYNILTHKMTLIGPRPVIPEEVELIERRKFLGVDHILPGITGWAQINGRDDLDYLEKAEYDYDYLQNMNVKMDLKIMFTTAIKIIRHEHVSH